MSEENEKALPSEWGDIQPHERHATESANREQLVLNRPFGRLLVKSVSRTPLR